MTNSHTRHCEQSEAIQSHTTTLDCFVANAPRNDETHQRHSGALAKASEPGISRHNVEIPDRSAYRGLSGMTKSTRRTS